MGVKVYDPSGRQSRTQPWQPPRAAPPEPRQGAPGSIAEYTARRFAGTNDALKPQKDDDDDKGLGERFFGTTVGKGLGTVLNNPIIKGALQPLDILGVPQRAIASAGQELVDVAQGEGFSPQDFYDQTNPLFFAHGENAEDSIGVGDIIADVGGTGNQYADAALGFAGDVATDPLTYFFGAGLVDKGLDAARSGSRLAAAARGGKALDKAREIGRTVKAGGKAPINEAAKAGSRASLTGRATRMDRTSQAFDLIEQADSKVLDELYGVDNIADLAQREIQRRAQSGLTTGQGSGIGGVDELVDTALNVKGPATRARIPFTGQQGKAIPGSEGFAGALGDATGKLRSRYGASNFGQNRIAGKSPLDYENAIAAMSRPGTKLDEFGTASKAVRATERARPSAGRFLNLGQRAVRQNRKKIRKEISEAGGEANYLRRAETLGDETALNRLLDFARDDLAMEQFGVTIPRLGAEGIDYVPHTYSRKFLRRLKSDEAFRDQWVSRFGGNQQDLLGESGRLQSRQLTPGSVVELNDGSEFVVPQSGTIADINEAGGAAGLGKILEDNPLAIIDDYIQGVSEDVGRRAGRAEMIALGDDKVGYTDEVIADPARRAEVDLEQESAVQRLQAQGYDDAAEARPTFVGQEERVARNAEVRDANTAAAEGQRNVLLQTMTEAEANRVMRSMAEPGTSDTITTMLDQWKDAGGGGQVISPEVSKMLSNMREQIKDPAALSKAVQAVNRFFKTYAVLTPGFHIRNAMSAIFMNAADGVPLTTTVKGVREWHKFASAAKKGTKEGMDYMDNLRKTDPKLAQAFDSVFGSGAGGRFTEAGVADSAGGTLGRALLENPLTRASQNSGAWVEGSVRLGMAMDTLEKGGSMSDAISRVTRVHFDYSQTSRLDDKAKQIAPFWSFISRNIPLQIMQQWSRPGAYQAYEHFKDNFAQPEVFPEGGEEVPGYIQEGGGIPFNLGPFGNWLEPDLPHTRVQEDVERLGNIASDPGGMLSNVSPVYSAPAEFAFGKDAFTGQTFGLDDVEHVSNPLEAVILPLAWATGSVHEENGEYFIDEKFINAVSAINPVWSRASRISGTGGQESERQWEAALRTAGFPVRNITEKQIENAALGDRFDAKDQRDLERALRP